MYEILKIAEEFKKNPEGIDVGSKVLILDMNKNIAEQPSKILELQRYFFETHENLTKMAKDATLFADSTSRDISKITEKKVIEDYSKKLLGKIEKIEDSTSYIESYLLKGIKESIDSLSKKVDEKDGKETVEYLKKMDEILTRLDRGMYFVKTSTDYMVERFGQNLREIHDYAKNTDWRTKALLSEFHKIKKSMNLEDYENNKDEENRKYKNLKDWSKE